MPHLKTWIKVKRGILAPKHQNAIAHRLWLYLHILDRTDWETGKAFDWKDTVEAEDLGINVKTLRRWRRELAEEGYITCEKGQHGQTIVVHNWTDPRRYDAHELNQSAQGSGLSFDAPESPSESPSGYTLDEDSSIPSHITDNNSKDSSAKNSKDSSAEKGTKPDRPPAVDVFREEMHRYPHKRTWAEIDRRVGRSVEALNAWRDVLKEWALRGYNPVNLSGQLQVFASGWQRERSNGHSRPTAKDTLDQWANEHAGETFG